MLGALVYLRLTSFKNWVWSRLRRLRQPKYLFGAIVGCAYFYFFFFRPIDDASRASRRNAAAHAAQSMDLTAVAMPMDWLPVAAAVGAVALLVFCALIWIVPTQRAALGFTEAEIAFLFPAPISRRALVHFRLLSGQFRSLAGAAVMMLFTNRWTFLGGNAFTHAVGWWFVFSTLNLHFTGATFTLTRLGDLGLGAWRRRAYALILVGTIIAVAIARLPAADQFPVMREGFGFRATGKWLVTLADTAPLSWAVWPLRQVLGPFLAVDLRQFFIALGPALAVVILHYLWVVRSAVAFEDSSIDQAQQRAARAAAWRAGDRRLGGAPAKGRGGPFRLASAGRPELAFLWKNLLSTWPYFTARVWLGCALAIVGGGLWLNTLPDWRSILPGIGTVAIMFAAYTLVVGPQFARQDIRSDLVHADLLKTYPLAGWQIILGELLTPAAILTGMLWLVLLVLAVSFQPLSAGVRWLTPQLRVVAGISLAAITPALVALQLLVPSAAALLFPAWAQTSRTRGGGPEMVGQRMIFFFAQLLTMLLALAPAALMAALLIFVLQWLIGPATAVGVAAAAVLIVLIGEVWCGVWWLGGRFEKLDVSADLRP